MSHLDQQLPRLISGPDKQRRHYQLFCRFCGNAIDDDGYLLVCPWHSAEPALLTTSYAHQLFTVDSSLPGFFRYHQWLPLGNDITGLRTVGKPITYHSQHLGPAFGLSQLWLSFNGYWPEKQAILETATFKELEAYAVLARIARHHAREEPVLVVSSAGNTAAAFAQACSHLHIPCLIILPESGLQCMQFATPLHPCVKIVALRNADYSDAIALAKRVAQQEHFMEEGGVKNVARRDGLATVLLSAVEVMGQLPTYYFQAVGSGSGAIAVHEAATRLIQDGRFGLRYPHLMLSQNLPFVPMYRAWKLRQRNLEPSDREEEKRQIQQIAAQVLSNRNPPYSLPGGVFDVLSESQGEMFVATNQEAQAAMQLFAELEGIDIHPASAVALATLLKVVQSQQIEKDAYILLNITGGGWQRRRQEHQLMSVLPTMLINEQDIFTEATLERIIAAGRG